MKKNDRVRVKGNISRETAEVWRRGDLKSNNGLRQSKGRASLSSEQPDVWIDEEPTFVQQLWGDLAIAVRREFNRIIYAEILPRVRDMVWNKWVPAVEKRLHELKQEETKAFVSLREKATQESTILEDTVKRAGKVINIANIANPKGV